MEKITGILKIHVSQGVNLAVRDMSSSDPYVVIQFDNQKLRTDVVKKCLNPKWDEDLTLSIKENKNLPIKLEVYDWDLLSRDDKMGEAELQIGPLLEVVNTNLENVPSGTIIKTFKPSPDNCLAEESCIRWVDGKVIQTVVLKLKNVESGEVELQLKWNDAPIARSAS